MCRTIVVFFIREADLLVLGEAERVKMKDRKKIKHIMSRTRCRRSSMIRAAPTGGDEDDLSI